MCPRGCSTDASLEVSSLKTHRCKSCSSWGWWGGLPWAGLEAPHPPLSSQGQTYLWDLNYFAAMTFPFWSLSCPSFAHLEPTDPEQDPPPEEASLSPGTAPASRSWPPPRPCRWTSTKHPGARAICPWGTAEGWDDGRLWRECLWRSCCLRRGQFCVPWKV